MSLLKREKRSLDGLVTIIENAGGRGRGSTTTAPLASTASALKVAAVWSCVRLVADALAAAPLDVYRKSGDVRENIATPPVLLNPDPTMTQHEWMFSLVASLMLTGDAFALKQEWRQGWPQRLTLIDPSRVQPVIDGGTLVGYKIDKTEWAADAVLHVKAFTLPGSVCGVSPLTQFAQTIGLGAEAEKFGYSYFATGGVPSGLIYSDSTLTKTQADELKQSWLSSMIGKREPAVLGAGLKYEQVSVNPDESQFIESQHFTIEQICRIFGVPPEMIGHASSGSSITYANIEERQIAFQQWTLLPWAARIEAALTSVLPRPQFVRFNLDAMLRVSLLDRYKAHGMSLRDGWRNADEVRRFEDEKPIPNGDTYLWPTPIGAGSASGGTSTDGGPTQ